MRTNHHGHTVTLSPTAPRNRLRLAAASLAIGLALATSSSTASAQAVFSGKQDKIGCTGNGTLNCTFTTFLVNRGDPCTLSPVPPAKTLCPRTITIDSTMTTCGTAIGSGIDAEILKMVPQCKADINAGPRNNPISLVGGQGVLPGSEYISIADSGAQSTFFDVCMIDNNGNAFRVGGNTGLSPATMCGFTFQQKLKQKIGNGAKPGAVGVPAAPVPGLPMWGVLLLAAGLASGGLLLRRHGKSGSSRS